MCDQRQFWSLADGAGYNCSIMLPDCSENIQSEELNNRQLHILARFGANYFPQSTGCNPIEDVLNSLIDFIAVIVFHEFTLTFSDIELYSYWIDV